MAYRIHFGKARDTPPSRCPYCGKMCDIISGVSNKEVPPDWPSPGAISMCTECAEIITFDEYLRLRKLTGEEFADLAMSEIWPIIQASRYMLKQMRRARMGVYN